jgi:dienelactone hydrolase
LKSSLYYLPRNTGCRLWLSPLKSQRPTAVLVIGGSGGYNPYLVGKALAGRGYPSLVDAYYGGPDQAQQFKLIPLEDFEKALVWLEQQTNARKLVVLGVSRGSEAAMLLGTYYPSLVNGVIAIVPSSVANGCNCAGNDATPTWMFGGKPVPTDPVFHLPDQTPLPQANEKGTIDVEKIAGPVFLLCATDDEIWPSCPYTTLIADRLKAASVPPVVIKASGADHYVSTLVPYSPTEGDGAFLVKNQQGREEAWPKLLAFLNGINQS